VRAPISKNKRVYRPRGRFSGRESEFEDMRIWGNILPERASHNPIAVVAAGAMLLLGANAPSASAQAIYDSLSTPVTNTTGVLQANRFIPGVQYSLNYGSAKVINNRVVTPLMADDLFLTSDGSGGVNRKPRRPSRLSGRELAADSVTEAREWQLSIH